MTNLVQTILFSTRSNDGIVNEYSSLNDALESFIADDGYRIDFHFIDGRSLSIYRSEYNEDFDDKTVKLYSQSNVLPAKSQVMYFNAHNNNDEYNNVVYVDF
jgi:hypothetical protein